MSDLRGKLKAGRTIWCVGVYDSLSAKVAEAAGFDAVMTGGFGVTASLLGMPDLELLSLAENVAVVSRVSQAIAVPVVADIDTGYGNTVNVWRAVREFRSAGAQAVIIEDQVSPKRCAACVDETVLVPIDEAAAKIRAARDAAAGEMIIIARTDAFDPREAHARALAYVDAGADLIQPVSKTFSSYDELAQLRRECDRPLSIQILGWLEGLQPAAISEIAGLATFSLVPLMTATAALMRNLKFLRESLSCQALPNERTSLDEFKEFIGFNDLIEEHRKYAC